MRVARGEREWDAVREEGVEVVFSPANIVEYDPKCRGACYGISGVFCVVIATATRSPRDPAPSARRQAEGHNRALSRS